MIGAGVWWFVAKGDKSPIFRTVAVKRGDLEATISATGTVEPEEVVDVGAQVSGIISTFGKDKYGKMMITVRLLKSVQSWREIDDSLYSAAVKPPEPLLQQAKANKISADANVLQMKGEITPGAAGLGQGAEARPIRSAGGKALMTNTRQVTRLVRLIWQPLRHQ